MIPNEDLKVEHYTDRQPGGQHVGLTETGVKITHIPSGMIAICKSERSQHRNRAVCLEMIQIGLLTTGYIK